MNDAQLTRYSRHLLLKQVGFAGQERLLASRRVLADYGNMSSATLMFALANLIDGPPINDGVALAFGPGLAAEGFGFRHAT